MFAVAHRLLKDRRVGSDAGQAVLLNQLLQPAFLQEPAVDEVEPDGLALCFKLFQVVGHFAFPISSRATLQMLSTVKPNFSCSLARGADAPKVDMVMVAPSEPT